MIREIDNVDFVQLVNSVPSGKYVGSLGKLIDSSRWPRNPVRFPYSQTIRTWISGEFLNVDPSEIASELVWTKSTFTVSIGRDQSRKPDCSISVVAGPRNNRSRFTA
jgi:hypothetical protein